MEQLEQQRIFQSFLGGASYLIAKKESLNKINVFPVADGDTGSNLAMLMQTIVDQIDRETLSMKQLLQSVADASLMGARGNSGIIFAQYFNAVSRTFAQGEEDALSLAYAFKQAVTDAYHALLDPKEGTILTVMSVWSDALYQGVLSEETFENSLEQAKEKALSALQQTRYQLKILRQNRLVDSGAKGFYHFIEGFTNTYCQHENHSIQSIVSSEGEPFVSEMEHATEEPTFRYCSEFLIKEATIDSDSLKEQLKEQGDSLIVVGEKRLLKIHIHTNQPKELLRYLETIGTVINHKVDDMNLQFALSKKTKYPIAVVTDSIADIPAALIFEEQIHVLPVNILTDSTSYLDKITIDSKNIRDKIERNEKLSTAQPSIQSVDALLSFLEGKYAEILIITVSSKLSGTYQLIKQRIEAKAGNKEKIQVIDSKLNAAAQGLLVLSAVQAIKEGQSFSQVIETVNETIKRSFIYVSVASLTPMIDSGRIPQKIGRLAQKLNLHPIVSLDENGEGKLTGFAFSQQSATNKIIKQVKKDLRKGKLEALAITHADNAKVAHEMNEKLACDQLKTNHYTVESSAAIAISAGIGAIAVAGIRQKEERK